jgi:CBS domain-containing protein
MRRTQSTVVRDVANRRVVTVKPDTTLAQCARLMRDDHVGSVVVVDTDRPDQRPVGIVTDRDIVLEAVAPSLDPGTLTAADIMVTALGTVRDDDDVVDALARMREHGVRRLPVIAPNGSLAGIVALDDLLSALAEQLTAIVSVCAAERTKEGETRPTR